MALSAVQMLAVSIVNALTFELLVDIPITFVVSNSGPWATGVGVMGTLLFIAACVVYAFPDVVCSLTKKRVTTAFYTLLRYLLPWIGLKLLWTPFNYLLCITTMTMFANRCQRLIFINIAQFVAGGVCLYSALHRAGITDDFECWLLDYWDQTYLYRLFCGCPAQPPRPQVVQVTVTDTQVAGGSSACDKQPRAARSKSRKRRNSRRRSNSKKSKRCK